MGIELLAIILLVAMVPSAIYLRRLRLRRQIGRGANLVRLCNDIWDIATNVHAPALTRPLRDAIATIFSSAADELASTPIAGFSTELKRRRSALAQLSTSGTARHRLDDSERFKRLGELLNLAHERHLLPVRQHALARVAVGLSARLSEIDNLCRQAEQAMTLKSLAEAARIRAQVLRSCDTLPAQTAAEVKRQVAQRLPLLAQTSS